MSSSIQRLNFLLKTCIQSSLKFQTPRFTEEKKIQVASYIGTNPSESLDDEKSNASQKSEPDVIKRFLERALPEQYLLKVQEQEALA